CGGGQRPRGGETRAGIGIGFYGNSETSDGVSQLSSALLHANHTLSAIDHLVLETVERLGEAVRTELTTLEEVLAQRTELVAAARGARRQAEAVAQQLQGLAFWRGVPLSLLQVAEDVSFVEEYRWLAYVLLLLLELLVCLFTLLVWAPLPFSEHFSQGLSDFCSSPDTYILNLTQEETGLGSDILNYYFLCNQAVSNPFQQRLTLSQRALANIHSQLQGLEREAVPQFPSAQKPLLSLEETLNVTEGNFHQLVALVHCRGLHKVSPVPLPQFLQGAPESISLSTIQLFFAYPRPSLHPPCLLHLSAPQYPPFPPISTLLPHYLSSPSLSSSSCSLPPGLPPRTLAA
uniref:Protein tweety homolog n=1 Tax=Canis lupus dingo TaxID=286419 RepID=A0A8C0L047_CANLU